MFSLIADDEVFVDVEGYEGRYSVSNYGRIYSHRPKRENIYGWSFKIWIQTSNASQKMEFQNYLMFIYW